jgi:extracellular elastinolytic metalloproteinase
VTFAPVAEDGTPINAQLFVGHYEARATPVADTDPRSTLDGAFTLVPGTYDLLARANGYGIQRLSLTVGAGETRTLQAVLDRNVASGTNGATAAGDGINLSRLIDDTESTNWASLSSPVVGKKVTVRLDPSRPNWVVDEVQVSAMLRPPNPSDPGGDTGGQSRFSAVRQFRILVCRSRQCQLHDGQSVHVDLHQPGGRLPLRGAPASGARPDPALLRRAEHRRTSASWCSPINAPEPPRTAGTKTMTPET